MRSLVVILNPSGRCSFSITATKASSFLPLPRIHKVLPHRCLNVKALELVSKFTEGESGVGPIIGKALSPQTSQYRKGGASPLRTQGTEGGSRLDGRFGKSRMPILDPGTPFGKLRMPILGLGRLFGRSRTPVLDPGRLFEKLRMPVLGLEVPFGKSRTSVLCVELPVGKFRTDKMTRNRDLSFFSHLRKISCPRTVPPGYGAAMLKIALVVCCFASLSLNAFAQSAHTPAVGSEERKALMDAIRGPAEKDLKQKVIFNVDRLRVAGDWAYARVSPTRPDGSEVDFSRTKFQKLIDLGAFDPQGEALLFQESNGDWTVIEWVFGATDVPSAGWSDKHGGIPKSLLQ